MEKSIRTAEGTRQVLPYLCRRFFKVNLDRKAKSPQYSRSANLKRKNATAGRSYQSFVKKIEKKRQCVAGIWNIIFTLNIN